MHLKSVQDLQLNDHTYLIYSNNAEFFHCLVPFIREGIKKNEQSVIVIDDISREELIKHFKYLFREDDLVNLNNIKIIDFKDIYLRNNVFEKESTINRYIQMINSAIEEGYTGLRVFAEVSNCVKNIISEEIFLEWEEYAHTFFKDSKFTAICAYNRKYFSKEFLTKLSKTHHVEIDTLMTRF